MAYSVVVNPLFDDVISGLKKLEKERGSLAFAMLDQEIGSHRWSLTVAALWLDEISLREGISIVDAAIKQAIGVSRRQYYDLTRVRATYDVVVQELTGAQSVPELGAAYERVNSLEGMLFNLDDVVILLARPATSTWQLEQLSA